MMIIKNKYKISTSLCPFTLIKVLTSLLPFNMKPKLIQQYRQVGINLRTQENTRKILFHGRYLEAINFINLNIGYEFKFLTRLPLRQI